MSSGGERRGPQPVLSSQQLLSDPTSTELLLNGRGARQLSDRPRLLYIYSSSTSGTCGLRPASVLVPSGLTYFPLGVENSQGHSSDIIGIQAMA